MMGREKTEPILSFLFFWDSKWRTAKLRQCKVSYCKHFGSIVDPKKETWNSERFALFYNSFWWQVVLLSLKHAIFFIYKEVDGFRSQFFSAQDFHGENSKVAIKIRLWTYPRGSNEGLGWDPQT